MIVSAFLPLLLALTEQKLLPLILEVILLILLGAFLRRLTAPRDFPALRA
jgi:hypothetical protein